MAKVNMPLMSSNASGKLANSLVYFSWKGLDCVRSYVVPANPKTTSQKSQRGNFSDAVQLFHDTEFTDDDRSALNLAASVLKVSMSGFNWFVKKVVLALVASLTFTPYYGCEVKNIASTTATVEIGSDADKSASLFWGTSKTFMPNEVEGTWTTKVNSFSLTDLPSNSLIYFKVKSTVGTDAGESGIYFFKTLTA